MRQTNELFFIFLGYFGGVWGGLVGVGCLHRFLVLLACLKLFGCVGCWDVCLSLDQGLEPGRSKSWSISLLPALDHGDRGSFPFFSIAFCFAASFLLQPSALPKRGRVRLTEPIWDGLHEDGVLWDGPLGVSNFSKPPATLSDRAPSGSRPVAAVKDRSVGVELQVMDRPDLQITSIIL